MDMLASPSYRNTAIPLLASLRRRAGLTQEELAEAAGISVRTLRNLELGQVAQPRPQTLRALAAALRIDSAELRPTEQQTSSAHAADIVVILVSLTAACGASSGRGVITDPC